MHVRCPEQPQVVNIKLSLDVFTHFLFIKYVGGYSISHEQKNSKKRQNQEILTVNSSELSKINNIVIRTLLYKSSPFQISLSVTAHYVIQLKLSMVFRLTKIY